MGSLIKEVGYLLAYHCDKFRKFIGHIFLGLDIETFLVAFARAYVFRRFMVY